MVTKHHVLIAFALVLLGGCRNLPKIDMDECIISIGTKEFRAALTSCMSETKPEACIWQAYRTYHVADCYNAKTETEKALTVDKLDGMYATDPRGRQSMLTWVNDNCQRRQR